MKYTYLTKDLQMEIDEIVKDKVCDPIKCIDNPSYFMYHVLKIMPYRYQHLVLREFMDKKSKRIMICKSRQIGISIAMACLAIWYVVYNKANSSIYKNTKVGIISRDDNSAKKLMAEVKRIILNSPIRDCIKRSDDAPYNKKELHFNTGWILCFPPTDACRGNTFDLLIVDEAGFVEDQIFRDAMEPTVTAVDGKIILSSTPNGQKGFFYENFDPFDVRTIHEYKRFWFYYKMCENPVQLRIIEEKFKYAKATGNIKNFDQEYNALFTVDEESFFEDATVEEGIDRDLVTQYECKNYPCSIGIDYGMSASATAISVVAQKEKRLELLFQFSQVNFDENLIMDKDWEHSIPNLVKRYNVKYVVVDNCPMGNRTNTQLKNEGYPVVMFSFRGDQFMGERNRGYYIFRGAIKMGKLKYPDFRSLISEMKCLQEVKVDSGKYMKIKAPRGYKEDLCDSFMISCYPFLSDDSTDIHTDVIDYRFITKDPKIAHNGRYDHEWDKLKEGFI